MADNTTRTPGAGETIAADDVGGIKHQRVKMSLGSDGNAVDLDGTAQRGARVDPFQTTTRVQQTPTGDTAAYTAGDQYGGIMTITNAARFTGGGGRLQLVTVLCKDNVAPEFDLYFYDRSVTLSANNAAAALPSDADMVFFQFGLQIAAGNYLTALPGTPPNRVAHAPLFTSAGITAMSLPYVCNGTDLFCSAVIRTASTLTANTQVTFSFTFQPD